jgi:hypothetical protein
MTNIFTGKDDELVNPVKLDYAIVNIWGIKK